MFVNETDPNPARRGCRADIHPGQIPIFRRPIPMGPTIESTDRAKA